MVLRRIKTFICTRRKTKYFYFEVGVYALIGFLHVSSQLFVIMPWFKWQLDTWRKAVWFLVFNTGTFMIYWTYIFCSYSDPGYVPISASTGFSSSIGSTGNDHDQGLEGMMDNQCKKCLCIRPPRAHHCSVCKRCVLRFDHHCVWLNNCVGHGTHGNFIRFLLYVEMTCGLLFMTLVNRIMDLVHEMDLDWRMHGSVTLQHITASEVVFIGVNLMLDFIVLAAVGVLTVYQVYFMMVNTTNVENLEMDRVASYARRHNYRFKYPYDLGMVANIKSLLGHNKWIWMWPQKAVGDGYTFPVGYSKDDGNVEWPPAWYQEMKREKQIIDYSSSEEDEDETGHGDDNRPLHDIMYKDLKTDGNASDDSQEISRGHRRFGAHVRRGSEGYEVRAITVEEREKMLSMQV